MNINECMEKGFLKKIKSDKALANKELAEAEYDLDKAKKAFVDEDYKWSIVKSYYCMFHAARALLFESGYMENKHFAITVVLDELNRQGKLESRFVNDFKAAMSSREGADYLYTYSKEIAEYDIQIAKEFLKRIKKQR
jgi:uncharacterized protein (UPF0332 family)